MKNLFKILNNTIDYEGRTNKKGGKKKTTFSIYRIRIAYKLGGYWFCMPITCWASHTGVYYKTLYRRRKNKKPVGQVLGYEVLKRKKTVKLDLNKMIEEIIEERKNG